MAIIEVIRITCLVPGCRRTHPAGRFDEWICAKHWPLVPVRYRRAYATAKRRRRRRHPAALWRLWRICRRLAIEEAFMSMGP